MAQKLFVILTADAPGAGKTTAARLFTEIANDRGLDCRIQSDHEILVQLWLLGDRRFSSHRKEGVWGFNCSPAALRDALGMLVEEGLQKPDPIVGFEFVHGRRGVRDALRILSPVFCAGDPIVVLCVEASLELSRAQERSRIETGGSASADDAHYARVYGRGSLDLFKKLLTRRYPAVPVHVIANDGTAKHHDELRRVIEQVLIETFS